MESAYQPAVDSSQDNASLAIQRANPEYLVIRWGPDRSMCHCGCGGETKARFCPGHDAKFKGILIRAEANATPIILWFEQHISKTTPMDLAEIHGWADRIEYAAARLREGKEPKRASELKSIPHPPRRKLYKTMPPVNTRIKRHRTGADAKPSADGCISCQHDEFNCSSAWYSYKPTHTPDRWCDPCREKYADRIGRE